MQKRNRRQARQFAFQTLYANEFHENLNDLHFPEGHVDPTMDKAYANEIIQGVQNRQEELDQIIQANSKKWNVATMDKVDRAILRLSIWEMKFAKETLNPSIAINEAIQLSKEFGSDRSYKLVNGILDGFVKNNE